MCVQTLPTTETTPLTGGKDHVAVAIEWVKDGNLTAKYDQLTKARKDDPGEKQVATGEALQAFLVVAEDHPGVLRVFEEREMWTRPSVRLPYAIHPLIAQAIAALVPG